MSAVCCPHCGKALFLIQGDVGGPQHPTAAAPGGGTSGPSGSGSPGHPRCYFTNGKWSMDCPYHGRHGARQFPASGQGGPVVKCTGQNDDGSFCDQRVPLEVARQMTGVA